MQPQQYPPNPAPVQAPEPGSPGHDPYEFITNPAQAPKPAIPILVGSTSSTMQRALIAVGGLVVLIIIVIIAASLLSGGGFNATSYETVAEEQTELIRIATLGTNQAVGQPAKNFAVSAELSLTTSQQQLLAYLQKNGHKLSTKQLALKHNAATDTQLTAAQASSSFDATFTSIMQQQLTTYLSSLKSTYASASGKTGKQLLNTDYNAAQSLLTQSKQ